MTGVVGGKSKSEGGRKGPYYYRYLGRRLRSYGEEQVIQRGMVSIGERAPLTYTNRGVRHLAVSSGELMLHQKLLGRYF